nr:iron-sulfur cluster assembly accessory protein [Sphingorhabdus lutea]
MDIESVILLPNAARRVSEIAQKLGKEAVLRLSVDGGGCSGFQYRFGLADMIDSDDIMVSCDDAKLVVDPISFDLVKGSAVDFVESLGGKSFQVTNPQAQSGCGCGTSFSI